MDPKTGIDVCAGISALGALFKYLPEFAALLSALWTLWRFYEVYKDRKNAKTKSRRKK